MIPLKGKRINPQPKPEDAAKIKALSDEYAKVMQTLMSTGLSDTKNVQRMAALIKELADLNAVPFIDCTQQTVFKK